MRKIRMLTGLIAAAAIVLVASACATRGFVRTEDTVVDTKVDTLADAVDQTQARTSGRIDQVAQRAQAADASAQTSQAAADAAQAATATVGRRVTEVESALGTLITEVTINEAQGGFTSARSELPPGAAGRLDQLVRQLQEAGRSAFLEIEGHTDNIGDEIYNLGLGLRRAEAVKRYLYEQHDVPLHKMNTFSHGARRPAAPNNTREGRAQNRRVVIRVRP